MCIGPFSKLEITVCNRMILIHTYRKSNFLLLCNNNYPFKSVWILHHHDFLKNIISFSDKKEWDSFILGLLFWQKCQLATLCHLSLSYYVGHKMASAILLKQSSNVICDKSYSNLCAVNRLYKSLEALCSIIPSVPHWATNPTYVDTHPINSNLWGFPFLAMRSQFLLCY